MKIKEIGSRLGKGIKGWRIGDYIRQFSIVVAGIVVTFAGSNAISNHAKQKEIKAVMELVQSELLHNQKQLSLIRKQLDNERKMAFLLVENNFDYSQIPSDTLMAYQSLFTRLGSFKYTQDAVEILKNSSLMQQISDKNFLLSVMQSYEVLRGIEKDVTEYYIWKKESVFSIFSLVNDEDRELMRNGNVSVSYRVFLSVPSSRNFTNTVPSFFDPNVFSDADHLLKQSIEGISDRYK